MYLRLLGVIVSRLPKNACFRAICCLIATLLAWEPAVWAATQIQVTVTETYGKKTGITDFNIVAGSNVTTFSFAGPKPTIKPFETGWIESIPGCIVVAKKIIDKSVPGTVKCIKPKDPTVCQPGTKGVGGKVCPANLKPSPIPGIPNMCNDVSVKTALKEASSCAPYKNCTLKSKVCAKRINGKCLRWDATYDCGKNVTTTTPGSGGGGINCPGAVDCSDGSCISQTKETNNGFGKAASALQAAQTMQSDGSCDPVTGVCTVFPGKSMMCKNYEFIGKVRNNCCASPIPNPDLSNYIKLVMQMNTVDNAMMMLNAGGASTGIVGAWAGIHTAVSSGWTAMGNTASQAFTSITQPLVTSFDNIVGTTSSMLNTAAQKVGINLAQQAATKGGQVAVKQAVSKGATKGILGSVEQALMQKTAEWTAQTFGPSVTNALFATVDSSGAVVGPAVGTGSGGVGTSIGLSAGASTVLAGVMIAYAVYQIAVILVSLIFKCTKDQFSFLSNQKLKVCHTVGTGCGKSICVVSAVGSLFGSAGCILSKCIRWDTKGCCFNSPLSRIIQEQARPQLGKSWYASQGTDEFGYSFFEPSCGGLTTTELQKLDWSKIDLSEWVGILQTTGNWPGSTQSLDSLTGAGSKFDVGAQSTAVGTRLNAQQRVQDRIGNQNLNKMRQGVGQGLWNTVP